MKRLWAVAGAGVALIAGAASAGARLAHSTKRPLSTCQLAASATAVVKAVTVRWGPAGEYSFSGVPGTNTYTPLSLTVIDSFKGTLNGTMEVLVPGAIASDGMSAEGPLMADPTSPQVAYFFLSSHDGRNILAASGLFVTSSNGLSNDGLYVGGVSEPQLRAEVARYAWTPIASCPVVSEAAGLGPGPMAAAGQISLFDGGL